MNNNFVRPCRFKRFYLLLILPLVLGASGKATSNFDIDQRYGKLPLGFEANAGQVKSGNVQFLVHRRSQTVFLEPDGLTLRYLYRASEGDKVFADSVHLSFVGAHKAARMEGRELLAGRSNYFIGSDPRGWLTGIPQYQRVRTDNLYP